MRLRARAAVTAATRDESNVEIICARAFAHSLRHLSQPRLHRLPLPEKSLRMSGKILVDALFTDGIPLL